MKSKIYYFYKLITEDNKIAQQSSKILRGHVIIDDPQESEDKLFPEAKKLILLKHNITSYKQLEYHPVQVKGEQDIIFRIKVENDPLADYQFTTDKLYALTNKILNVYRISSTDKLIPIPYTVPDDVKLTKYEEIRNKVMSRVSMNKTQDLPIKTYIVYYFDNKAGTNHTIEVVARTLKSLFRKLNHKFRIKTNYVLWIRDKNNPVVDLYLRKVVNTERPKKKVRIIPNTTGKLEKKICIKKPIEFNEKGDPTKWEYKRVWKSELGEGNSKYSIHEWIYTSKSAYKKNKEETTVGKTYNLSGTSVDYINRNFNKWALFRTRLPIYKKLNSLKPHTEEWLKVKQELKDLNYSLKGSALVYRPIAVTTLIVKPVPYIKPPAFSDNIGKKQRKLRNQLIRNLVYINRDKSKRKYRGKSTLSTTDKLHMYHYNKI